jgi:hypothetical protein
MIESSSFGFRKYSELRMVESQQEEPEGMGSGGREEQRMRLVMLDGNRIRKRRRKLTADKAKIFGYERAFCARNVKEGGTAEALSFCPGKKICRSKSFFVCK